jgi:hypothetical protein
MWQTEPVFMLVFCLAYSSTLKLDVTYSSKTSVEFKRNIQRYIADDRTLHNHRCKSLKSYVFVRYVTVASQIFIY